MSHRLSVVILTHNRAAELRRTIQRMLALPEQPAIVVVDNASTDATREVVRNHFPQVKLISLQQNIGAAARNIGAREVQTPYVAFCDDDTWWESGSLPQAADLLDAHPQVAVLCARVLVGVENREDPTCALMANSPLPKGRLPGPALLGFLAGAVVMRRNAFLAAGGYEARFFLGGEEALLSLDLAAHGWSVVYVPDLIVHHYPSAQRDTGSRKRFLIRNALWVAWLRLPLRLALRQSGRILRAAYREKILRAGFFGALRALPWVLRKRAVVPPDVALMYRMLHR